MKLLAKVKSVKKYSPGGTLPNANENTPLVTRYSVGGHLFIVRGALWPTL